MNENGKSGRGERRVTHRQFYSVCEWIRGRKEKLLTDRPSEDDTAKSASSDLGFRVAKSTISDAKTATGVDWRARGGWAVGANVGNRKSGFTSHKIRRIAQHLCTLYLQLGAAVPEELTNIARSVKEGDIEPGDSGSGTEIGSHHFSRPR